jgi:hypothetical protein
MEILLPILPLIQDSPYFVVFVSVVTLASAISAVTPTPKEGTVLAKFYRILDWLSLNVGRAKDKG